MRTRVLSPDRVARTLDRLASEVAERNGGAGGVVVVGIHQRGARLADALAARLEALAGRPVPPHTLDVSAFRDDRPPPADAPPAGPPLMLAGRDVLLVDDVLATGRTVRAALDALVQHGRPRSIQLVVLVDRGGREYPIEATYVGRRLPVPAGTRVEVCADEGFAVDLIEED